MKKTKEKRFTKYWLVVIYFAMVGACVYLNYNDRKIENIVINGIIFVIVGIIFVFALRWFGSVDNIQNELMKVSERINEEYGNENKFLWDLYNKEDSCLFEQKDLKLAYASYKSEMRYLESQDLNNSTCDIEDYINRDLIDDVAKKNLLNLIPGAMTGMGILGTFIGLSFGLQNFNTGTAEEIADSISPLMDGIKVAFHTSIYGMMFSLFFNWEYKRIFERAYQTVDQFVDIYHEKVSPDAENDNLSKLIAGQEKQSQVIIEPITLGFKELNNNILEMCAVQQQQLQQMKLMPQVIEESIGRKLSEQIIPQFATMNNNFELFAKMVGDMQLKGMENLIDKFTTQTNAVMVDSYHNLKNVISDTCNLQEENGERMVDILNKVQDMTLSIQQINDLSQKTVVDMSGYVEKVENLQGIVNDNCISFGRQLEKNAEFESKIKDYITTIDEYQKQCGESIVQSISELKHQLLLLEEIEKQMITDVRKEVELLIDNTNECNKTVSVASLQQIEKIGAYSDVKTEDMVNAVQKLKIVTSEFADQLKRNLEISNDAMKITLEGSNKVMQKNLIDANDELKKNLENSNIITKKNMEEVNKQQKIDLEAINTDMNRNLLTTNDQLIKNLESLNIVMKDNLTEANNQLNGNLKASNNDTKNSLAEANNQLKNNLIEAASEVNKAIENVAKHMTGQNDAMIQEFNTTSQIINEQLREKLKQTLDEFAAELSKNVKGMIEQFGNTTKEIENSAMGLKDMSEKFQIQMSKELKKIFEDLADKLKHNLSYMTEGIEKTTTQFGESAIVLGNVTKELNKQLEKSLENTFVLFDRELADICTHLSGTISEVESTTERVPDIVSTAYEGMEKCMKEMETQMINLVTQIAEIENQIQSMKSSNI